MEIFGQKVSLYAAEEDALCALLLPKINRAAFPGISSFAVIESAEIVLVSDDLHLASIADLTSERARERLAAFRDELSDEPEPFAGCMSPLRIRLVAANGALVERQGCRGTKGWAKAASQLVADFMAAAAQAQADRDAALSADQAEAAGN